MTQMPRLFVLTQDSTLLTSLKQLQNHGFQAEWIYCLDEKQASQRALEDAPDAVLIDLKAHTKPFKDFSAEMKRHFPVLPLIVLASSSERLKRMEALDAGASDSIEMPLQPEKAVRVLQRALDHYYASGDLQRHVTELKAANLQLMRYLDAETKRAREAEDKLAAFESQHTQADVPALFYPEIFSSELISLARSSAPTILLEGEDGSGRKSVARKIHFHSSRASAPFITIDCSKSSRTRDGLIEEVLGLARDPLRFQQPGRAGAFECAHMGTLHIHHIQTLPLELQHQVLQILNERSVIRKNSHDAIPVDVRFIASASQDLDQAVDSGFFLEELYLKLRTSVLRLPALRDHGGAIPTIARRFLEQLSRTRGNPDISLTADVERAFLRYPWKGNFSELKNILERACLLCEGSTLTLDHFPEAFQSYARDGEDGSAKILPFNRTAEVPFQEAKQRAVSHFEEDYLLSLLTKHDGNISACARVAGIDRSNFLRLIRKYNLKSTPFRRTG